MKEKKKIKKVVKEIEKTLLINNALLKTPNCAEKHEPMMVSTFLIGNNDELLYSLSCLLKTCVLALESESSLALTPLANSDPKLNVAASLEFIINLLPRQQMVALDEINALLYDLELNKD